MLPYTKTKEIAATLIQYLLNEDSGTAAIGSQFGIPLSKEALANPAVELDATTLEANQKVLAWCSFPLDPLFEDAKLKSNDGYYGVLVEHSAGKLTSKEAAENLVAIIDEVYGA